MPQTAKTDLLLAEVLAAAPDIDDLSAFVRTALDQADPASLCLLKAGVLLKTKGRQVAGIRRAQKIKKKYPGPAPKALKMGGTALKKLIALLEKAEEDRAKMNMSQWARDLGISRATLYRYLKAPGAVGALKAAKKAIGQGYRARDPNKTHPERLAANERKAHSESLAAVRMERALKDAGLSRSNRPILEAVSAERKAVRAGRKIDLASPKHLNLKPAK